MTAARSRARWLAVVPALPGGVLVFIGILWTEVAQTAAGTALVLVAAALWRITGGRWGISANSPSAGTGNPGNG